MSTRPTSGAGGDGRRSRWARAFGIGAAAGLALLLVGDRAGQTATPPGQDPLQILDFQAKQNVIFVVDTSSSMGETPDGTGHFVGGDDPASRLYQTKVALRDVIAQNAGKANFGIVTFSPGNASKVLVDEGPLVYVSADATAANWAGFFNDIDNDFNDYDGDLCLVPCSGLTCVNACSQEVFESLGTSDNGYGTAYNGRHYIQSRLFRNGALIEWDNGGGSGNRRDRLTALETISCPMPPAGLTADNPDADSDGFADQARPCFQLRDTVTKEVTTYFYTSGAFGTQSSNCDGVVVNGVPGCTVDNSQALQDSLRLEMPTDSNGSPTGVQPLAVPVPDPATNDLLAAPNNQPDLSVAGIRLGGSESPVGEALRTAHNHYDTVVFPNRPAAADGKVLNFVILITDGVDDCGAVNPVTEVTDMWANHGVNNRMETLVVAFTNNSAAISGAQSIALAGSGNARGAFKATTQIELTNALNAALAQTLASGTFSTESSITESIFELVTLAGGTFDPRNPETRYGGRVPVLLQTSFEMPGFKGHLKAFVNQAGVSVERWDAATRLQARVGISTPSTFDQLHAGATPATIRASSALIKRRIFTSSRNGVFPYGDFDDSSFGPSTEQRLLPLWPPTTSTSPAGVAPADDVTAGVFDDALGVGAGSSVVLTFAELQAEFGACRASSSTPLPGSHACLDPDPAVQLSRARREARERILAWSAGAQLVLANDGLPQRQALTGELLYENRIWLLSESTLAVPAVVTPPLEARPTLHTAEYVLFRDGPRNSTNQASNGVDQGFGLRNPDKDSINAALTPPRIDNRTTLKPSMSVVYHATNDMLHAFRAGPSCEKTDGTCTENGGEELWGYVPFDQLEVIKERMKPQGRANHSYMLASSIRFTDVFVPDADGYVVQGRTFLGRWRTVLYFGRGIGGKHYTALDVTSPGPFTRLSLDANEPFAVWSRGNPDTQDGKPSIGSNDNHLTNDEPGGSNDIDLGSNDLTAYALMGETWSVPAVAAVPPDPNFGKEFAVFAGSGYSTDPNEGKTFYTLDALTGDVLFHHTVPDSLTGCTNEPTCVVPQNALVANPSAYIAAQLAFGFVGNPAASQASLVYIGDVHGRVWKMLTSQPSAGMVQVSDFTPDQPIATAVALLNINGRPHVFAETGNDNRVDAPPNFQMHGLRDDTLDTDPTTQVTTPLFQLDFGPIGTSDFSGYRGTAQPATAFSPQRNGRVFFIGTKLTVTNCVPTFNSVLFALGAQSGGAAYDLNTTGDDRAVLLTNQRVTAVRGASGQIVLDKGILGAAPPAPPPAPGAVTGPLGSSGEVFIQRVKSGTAVCQ